MPLQLSPMLYEDIDAFGILDELAMKDWTFAQLMDGSRRQRREFVAEWARSIWNEDDKRSWVKVTETETGQMIAMSMWRIPVQLEVQDFEHSDTPADAEDSIEKRVIEDAEVRTKKFWENVESIKKGFFREFLSTRPHAYLHLLLTHPDHRRRGAGSMLVKWGCDKADELGIIAACTASAAGEAVYMNNGFEVKKAVEMDLSPFGKNEIELRRFMVREPPSSTTAV